MASIQRNPRALALDALWALRDVISETSDIEMVPQDGGSYIAFGLTEKGRLATQIYGSTFPSFEKAYSAGRMLKNSFRCRVLLPPRASTPEELENFRRAMEDRPGNDVVVIAGGIVYAVGQEPDDLEAAQRAGRRSLPALGHGGRAFRIRWNDGSEKLTHNLQGGWPVPPELASEFRDTATLEEVR